MVVRKHLRNIASPEYYARHRDPTVKVDQSCDIWSVGCVLSMAATWVVLGNQGIYQYNIVRQKAIRTVVERSAGAEQRDINPGDFFHNGKDVLPEIKQWHQYLRSVARHTDHITNRILDLVEEHLLVAQNRMSAEDLYKRLQTLLEETKKDSIPAELADLMDTLCQIDGDALSNPEDSEKPQASTRPGIHQLKSPIRGDQLQVPKLLKTASRYEALTKISASRSPKLEIRHLTQPMDTSSYFFSEIDAHEPTQNYAVDAHILPDRTSPPVPLSKRSSTFYSQRLQDVNSPAPQNVIQAREEFRDSAWFKKSKDTVLTAHFDNRDIVSQYNNFSTILFNILRRQCN
jgi:hypothetical protein